MHSFLKYWLNDFQSICKLHYGRHSFIWNIWMGSSFSNPKTSTAGKFKIAAVGFILISFWQINFAQCQWGSGQYMAAQNCGYQYEVADGAVDPLDGVKAVQSKIKILTDKKTELEEQAKKAESDVDRHKVIIERTLRADVAVMVEDHIENTKDCAEYKDFFKSTNGKVYSRVQKPDGEGFVVGEGDHTPFSSEDWGQLCIIGLPGAVQTTVCDKFSDKKTGLSSCKSSLQKLGTATAKKGKLQNQIEELETKISDEEDNLTDAKGKVAKARRDAQKQMMEGGCTDCAAAGSGYVYKKQGPSIWQTLGGVALGLGGLYAGYQGWNNAIESNAQLGFPTNPAQGMGYPFMLGMGALNLYGAITGGYGGAYGCGNTAGGMNGANGMMGYPQNYYGGLPSGGMYQQGGFPGASGPFGAAGQLGFPGMGGQMGYPNVFGQSGFPGANQMGFNPPGYPGIGGQFNLGGQAGYPNFNGQSGFPGANGFGAYGNGFGQSGFPGAFGQFGIGAGNGSGYPGAAGGAGYPGGQFGLGGQFGFPGASGAGYGTGYPGVGGAGYGTGYPGGGYDSLGSGQMQSQMMQMQMQQYQAWMQQQQQAQENAIARQRVVSGLQQEMYSLQYRLQQAQYGLGGNAGVGVGVGVGGSFYGGYGTTPSGGYGTLPYGNGTGYPVQGGTPGGTVPTVR